MHVKLNTVERQPLPEQVSCDHCPIRSRAVCANCEADDLDRLEAAKYDRCYQAGQVVVWAGERMDFVASVIDGDTIEIHGTRIRLNGIDAPESGQLCQDARGTAWRCGQQAALALSDRTGGGRWSAASRPTPTVTAGSWRIVLSAART